MSIYAAQASMKYDTVVIGSGISGLCASLALARHGQRVALIERAERLAPLLRRFDRGGWWCDPGVHYVGGIHSSGPLAVMFRYLGLDTAIHTIPLSADEYDIVHTDGAEPIRFPTGLARVQETLTHRYPRSRDAIAAYLKQIATVHRTTPFMSFDFPVAALTGTTPISAESLASFLARHGAEKALIEMLGRFGALLYGSAGHECPFALHATTLGSFYYSAHAFCRGGDEVVDAFDHGLKNTGVDVYQGRAVVGLELDHHRHVRAVLLEGADRLASDSCICTIHPHLLPDLLPPDTVRPAFISRIGNLENTFGPMVVFVEVDDLPAELARSNVYFIGAEAQTVPEDTSLVALVCPRGNASRDRKSLCLLRPCAASLPPWEAYGPHGRRLDAYKIFKRTQIEQTVDLFHRYFPGRQGKCRVLEAATPCTYRAYTGTVQGAAYGTKQSSIHMPLHTRTPVGGLFLAGQSVVAPGLLGAMISSLLAVCHVVGLQPVWDEIQRWR